MRIGLLIVDMQRLFMNEVADKHRVAETCEYINYVSGLLRAAGQPVIHIQDMEGAQHDADPEARSIIPEVVVGPNDLRVEKEYSNAFWKTDLEQMLRDQGVEFVVVSGFSAEYCVTFTANGAAERGFPAAILQRGILSANPDAVSSIYRDRHVVSHSVINYMTSVIGKTIAPE
ncbi:cysteine hydrolase family protein [Paenibacillus arenilitoris]|uniref:Cysteine hydrolase n=1 Tax=Paenibacillus arenilitoris TaxID=2772299 RepID=A0A927H533_9BACL|nr:isochorismatase family cysteine hydrolase [Paenibacillus arenilitoris]MBD2869056.1 cysteine hydrolase [Paenibacillus arenilitoris]